ncbi:MAG: hypothetical protein HY692_03590 [Cyanobacteria bacterium NC_groundwater_1444_Ag_S-0.65um_54_12]|nr:hypothetical protein [Cyanobacteria bacterium NC_groundwater_1444_Ag_S-0.65um_54_12]
MSSAPAYGQSLTRPATAVGAGMELLLAGEYKAAAKTLAVHVRTHPRDEAALYLLAQAYWRLGETAKAQDISTLLEETLANGTGVSDQADLVAEEAMFWEKPNRELTLASAVYLAAGNVTAAGKATPLEGSAASTAEITGLIRGAKILNADAKWTAAELQALLAVVRKLSATDRQQLTDVRFVRSKIGQAVIQGKEFEAAGRAEIGLDGSKTIYLYDIVHQISSLGLELFGDPDPVQPVLFHEIGHLIQTFAPDKIQEFASLGFKDDGSPEPDGFISHYASLSPEEDHAESYRALYLEPAKLLKIAPLKFLTINARTRRYPAKEVRLWAQRASVNLQQAADNLVLKGRLRLATSADILGYHGLRANLSVVIEDARALLAAPTASPLERAASRFLLDCYGGGLRSLGELVANDALWEQFTAVQKAVILNKSYSKLLKQDIVNGVVGARGLANDIQDEVYREGFKKFFLTLLSPQPAGDGLRAALSSPDNELYYSGKLVEQVLRYQLLWPSLHPQVVRLLTEGGNRGTMARIRLKRVLTGPEFGNALSVQKQNYPSKELQRRLDQLTTLNALLFFRLLAGEGTIPPMDPTKGNIDDPFVYVATDVLHDIYTGLPPNAGTGGMFA